MIFIKDHQDYTSHFFDAGNGVDPIGEICALARSIYQDADVDMLMEIHYDVVDIFTGKNPLFKRNSMYYHTLRHTLMVTLAAMRLLHGLHCEQRLIDRKNVLQGLLCAYFHDIGMLVKKGDPTVNGSFYIPIHEQRSAVFLKEYIDIKGWSAELAEDVDVIIAYTWLRLNPADFRTHSPQKQILGQVVGAADLFAQMGDRYYLESLPLLFKELERGKLNMYENVLDLLAHTTSFFREIVEVRLRSTYRDVFGAMQTHFRVWNGIDKNLYMESIEKNLSYIGKVLAECADIDSIYARLRRRAPILEPGGIAD